MILHRFLNPLLSCLLILTLPVPSVRADLRGLWSCVYSLDSGGDFPSDLLVTGDTGTMISGVGRFSGTTTDFSSVIGTISGANVSFSYDYYASSYAATVIGTVSENQMVGTWESNSNQSGPFVCSRGSGKRPSTVRIICNRSGDLSSAVCGATVGDAGAPPRRTPTGTVQFSSREGAPLFAASCTLQPTTFSPGVSFCSVQYTPPQGCPVGAPFLLDALYEGDEFLDPSATEHALLMATCVGDGTTPCAGAIGVDFGNESHGILRDSLSLQGLCGRSIRRHDMSQSVRRSPADDCQLQSEVSLSLVDELQEFDEEQWREMAESITDGDARADDVLRVIREIGQQPSEELQATLQNTLKWTRDIQRANQQYLRKQTSRRISPRSALYARASSIPRVAIPFAGARTIVRNGREKRFTLPLNSRARRMVRVFKDADRSALNLAVQAKVKRVGNKRVRQLKTTQELPLH